MGRCIQRPASPRWLLAIGVSPVKPRAAMRSEGTGSEEQRPQGQAAPEGRWPGEGRWPSEGRWPGEGQMSR